MTTPSTPWYPIPSEERAAVSMLVVLSKLSRDEQVNALALLVRLWCYHRDQQHAHRTRGRLR